MTSWLHSEWSSSATEGKPLIEAKLLETDLIDAEEASVIDQHLDAVAKAACKRKRHRDIVARARLRQKASVAAMRAEEISLCKKLNRMLIRYDRQRNIQVDEEEQQRALVHRSHHSHHAYVEQVAMQQYIRRENEHLQHHLKDLSKFRRTIEIEHTREITDEDRQNDLASKTPLFDMESHDGKASWLYFDGDEEPFYYEPLSEQSCMASMQVVYQRMIDLFQDFSLGRIAVHETQCLGWKVQRPLFVTTEQEKRLLRFQFTKTVRCVEDTMEAIVERTWRAFHDPTLYAKIYSTVVVTRVVQRVNANMTVLLQNSPNSDGSTNIRYFNMLAKMTGRNEKNERIVALVKTIVNPEATTHASRRGSGAPTDGVQPATQPNDIEWMKHGFSFLLLTEAHFDAATGERTIQLHYGTHYECISEEHARYLMIEVLGLAARWEQLVLPTFHLTF